MDLVCMRQSIETAPRDRKTIIIEDKITGTSDFAHWSPEGRHWVRQNGELSKITPTHWYPIPIDQQIAKDKEGDFVDERDRSAFNLLLGNTAAEAEYPVSSTFLQVGSVRRGFAAFAIATFLVAATLIGFYFEFVASKTRSSHLEEIYRVVVEQLFGQVGDESIHLNDTGEAATAELWLERRKTAELTSELATVRSELDTTGILFSKEVDDAAQLKKTANAATAELQQERERTVALTGELTTARRDLETKLTVSGKAGDEAAQLKKTAEAATAELQQERQRTAVLSGELATARRDLETKLAVSGKAGDEAAQLRKMAEATTAELLQERQLLTGELATARRDLETKLAVSSKAGDEAAQLR